MNIKTTMSSDSDDIVSANYINQIQQYMPYFDASMSSFCIGFIKFGLKNPQKFMPNVKVNIKVAPPPSVSRVGWNKFKDAIWPISHTFRTLGLVLASAAGGAALGSWKYNVDIIKGSPELVVLSGGGIFWGLVTGFLVSDSGYSAPDFKMTINRIPFKYSLDPISEQEAKTLQENKVRAGEKKKDKKEYDQRYEEIQGVNGFTLGESISNNVLIKGYNILNNPDVDPGDPFGLMRNAKFLKLDGYKYPRNFEDYFSDEESKAINKQNAMKKSQFCKNHSDDQEGINISNYSSKILATLSRDNPVQYVAIMVNSSVEAAKLRKLLERSYSSTSQLSYRLNISFSTEITSSLPDGSTADEDTERKAEIALGTGPSRPARIVSFFIPHGVAGYASSLVDFIWKPIYSGGAWACDKIKSKFLIEKDPVWVIPQEDNPPWVAPEVGPGVDPPWTIPPKADPWYKRAWDKVKSWFRSSNDRPNQQQNNQVPPDGQQQGGQRPQDQQNQNNQNNQQQQQNPYNNGPNYYDPSAANGQAQQQQNSQVPPGGQQQGGQRSQDQQNQNNQQQQQNHQAPPSAQQSHNGQQSTQRLSMYDEPIIDRDSAMAIYNDIGSNNKSKDDNNDNYNGNLEASENDRSEDSEVIIDNENEDNNSENSNSNEGQNDCWKSSEANNVPKNIDLSAIPQKKNRDGNFSRNSTQSAFKVDSEDGK